MNNGLLWRGDNQGQYGIYYAITIPEIQAYLNFAMPVNIPITVSITDIQINPLKIPTITFSGLDSGLGGDVAGSLGPINIYGENPGDPIFIHFGDQPLLKLNIGNPDGSTVVTIGGTAGLGPITIPLIDLGGAPGYGNSTTNPSSGFFNSGAGGVSGFGNFGANISGWQNAATGFGGVSGFRNVGAQQSGLLNWGNTLSGVYNTSGTDLSTP
ncbi:hypothetical protein, partial [Mycobacterium kiyosense]